MLDSVIIVNKKYYPQILLEKCKYEIKKTKIENLINYDLEARTSDDETGNNSLSETELDNGNQFVEIEDSISIAMKV